MMRGRERLGMRARERLKMRGREIENEG